MSSEERTSAAALSRPCDPGFQQARQDALEDAYKDDGRDDPAHLRHGLYTGLAAAQQQQQEQQG